jgi:hypothetical protein
MISYVFFNAVFPPLRHEILIHTYIYIYIYGSFVTYITICDRLCVSVIC